LQGFSVPQSMLIRQGWDPNKNEVTAMCFRPVQAGKEKPKVCPQCQAENLPRAVTCVKCGARLPLIIGGIGTVQAPSPQGGVPPPKTPPPTVQPPKPPEK
jgi:ribosomal protein L40E